MWNISDWCLMLLKKRKPAVDNSASDNDTAETRTSNALAFAQLHDTRSRVVDVCTGRYRTDGYEGSKPDRINYDSMRVYKAAHNCNKDVKRKRRGDTE
jgi:hypothetical protein